MQLRAGIGWIFSDVAVFEIDHIELEDGSQHFLNGKCPIYVGMNEDSSFYIFGGIKDGRVSDDKILWEGKPLRFDLGGGCELTVNRISADLSVYVSEGYYLICMDCDVKI